MLFVVVEIIELLIYFCNFSLIFKSFCSFFNYCSVCAVLSVETLFKNTLYSLVFKNNMKICLSEEILALKATTYIMSLIYTFHI